MNAANGPLPHSYDYRLVALSVLIAILASYTALDLAGRVTAARGRVRLTWLTGGAIAMGLGARKAGKRITTADKKTLRLLESYYWPGNIRELQNVIERSVIVCETENFSVDESWLSQKPPERKAEGQLYLSEKVATQEKEIIEAALRECQGRVFGPSGAAAKLGIVRSTLDSKIRSLKINKNLFGA